MNNEQLIEAAKLARETAYAPYSNFKVGAALLTAQGNLYTGCNVENASYGLTICAERIAVFNAIAAGERHFDKIAVVADTPTPTPPCGACRQVMMEFGIKEIVMANIGGEYLQVKLTELLPYAFSGSDMES